MRQDYDPVPDWLTPMAKRKFVFEDLFSLGTRAEIRAAISASQLALGPPEAQTLISHLETMEPPAQLLRIGIVHSYTSELIEPWLTLEAALQGLELRTYHAPYGMTVQEAQPDSGLVSFGPDLTLLLLQREYLHPDLVKPLAGFTANRLEELRAEVLAQLSAMLLQFRQYKVGQIVLALLPTINAPGLGIFDAQSEFSENTWRTRLEADVAHFMRGAVQASVVLDLDEVLRHVGRANFFDRRLWYSARFPFSSEASREIARRIIALGVVIKLPKAKVIVLDADNTLWGGIIGEDGIDGIALGPDYPGNTFVDFQRRILDYQQRGFVLALCSKNNPADVDQVLKTHPHQLLREEHFAARRVNWLPKPDNLISLSEELNLGLDSFIFVDDSDHECAAVRKQLPLVEVVQTPARSIDIPNCLEQVARLEVVSLTAEDRAKTGMYAQERRRREMITEAENSGVQTGDYLRSLDMKMHVSFSNPAHVTRLSQLTKKTNQFNLTTRRYDEQQMQEFISDKSWLVADFALADIFGHSGIVGLAIIRLSDTQEAELNTYLMSCRVIGRDAESAFLHCLLGELNAQGIKHVFADFFPTAKNDLAKNFLTDQGFTKCADGRFVWDLADSSPRGVETFPISVLMNHYDKATE